MTLLKTKGRKLETQGLESALVGNGKGRTPAQTRQCHVYLKSAALHDIIPAARTAREGWVCPLLLSLLVIQ